MAGHCVYVVETDAAVKIGITVDLDQRLRDLGKCSGQMPRLVRAFPMASRKHARCVEAWAHQELAADREMGEWFCTHPLIAADVVGRLAATPPEHMPLHPATARAIRRWLSEREVAA